MLKFEWPLVLPDDEDVRLLSEATHDISQYIVDIAKNEGIADGMEPLEGPVTVHLACHARAQNMGQKAAELLRLIPDADVNVVDRFDVANQIANLPGPKFFARNSLRTELPKLSDLVRRPRAHQPHFVAFPHDAVHDSHVRDRATEFVVVRIEHHRLQLCVRISLRSGHSINDRVQQFDGTDFDDAITILCRQAGCFGVEYDLTHRLAPLVFQTPNQLSG